MTEVSNPATRLMTAELYIVEEYNSYRNKPNKEIYNSLDSLLSCAFDLDDKIYTPKDNIIGIYKIFNGRMTAMDAQTLADEETEELKESNDEQHFHSTQPYR